MWKLTFLLILKSSLCDNSDIENKLVTRGCPYEQMVLLLETTHVIRSWAFVFINPIDMNEVAVIKVIFANYPNLPFVQHMIVFECSMVNSFSPLGLEHYNWQNIITISYFHHINLNNSLSFCMSFFSQQWIINNCNIALEKAHSVRNNRLWWGLHCGQSRLHLAPALAWRIGI